MGVNHKSEKSAGVIKNIKKELSFPVIQNRFVLYLVCGNHHITTTSKSFLDAKFY